MVSENSKSFIISYHSPFPNIFNMKPQVSPGWCSGHKMTHSFWNMSYTPRVPSPTGGQRQRLLRAFLYSTVPAALHLGSSYWMSIALVLIIISVFIPNLRISLPNTCLLNHLLYAGIFLGTIENFSLEMWIIYFKLDLAREYGVWSTAVTSTGKPVWSVPSLMMSLVMCKFYCLLLTRTGFSFLGD